MSSMIQAAEADKIRVLIADDLAAVRSGLRICISAFEDFVLVGEAANSDDAIDLCQSTRPHVVLFDLEMPGLCAVAAMRRIRYFNPDMQVIAMSSFQNEGLVQHMLDNGAIGCLLKNISSDDLAGAIRIAHRLPRPEREAVEPTFLPRPNVPCRGTGCPWGWNCHPTGECSSAIH